MRKLTLLLLGVMLFSLPSLAQRIITGKVINEKGNPLPNVSVVVKGTKVGTVTKEDGSFSLSVPGEAKVLVATAIGMGTQEMSIGNQSSFIFSLLEEAKTIDEVVVVGYGKAKRKENVAGSLTKVDGKTLHDKPTANILDALQGKVSGLQVYSSSGEPSATPSIRLHGVGSLGASNTPLYVLDGTPVNPGTIVALNPNDIASITVLKDPSTTAIYGSRAANGVLLYTTKQGRANSSKLSVTTQYGVSNLLETTKEVYNKFMNTKQLTDFWVDVGYRRQGQIDTLLASFPFDTKWYKTYYKENVPTYQLDLNMSGGGGKTTYYISGGYFRQEGASFRSAYERYTFRSNITSTVNDWFKFGLNLSGGIDKRQTNPYGSNSTNRGLALLAAPFYSPVDTNGVEYPDLIPGWGRYNPKYLAAKIQGLDKNVQFNPSVYAEIVPIKGLTIRSQAGIDAYDYTSKGVQLPSYIGSLNSGTASESFTRGAQSTITNTAEYNFKVNSLHEITLLAGHEYIKSSTMGFNASSAGLTDDRLILLGSGPNNRLVGSSKSEFAYQSFFGRLNYNWEAKYFIDLSLRQDQSSRFGRENRTANFWSVGGLWKAKKENFLSNINWLSDLSVRASYGTSGNSSIGDYTSLATVSNAINENQTSLGINTAGNPKLSWESQTQSTFGVDIALFKKVDLTVDYYIRKTSQQLFNVPYPYTSGFPSILDNVGAIKNTGIDVHLEVKALDTKDAYITPYITLNYNKDRITELFQGRDYWVVPSTGVSYVVGQSISFLYPLWAGVDPSNGNPLWYLPNSDPTKFVYGTKENGTTSTFNSAALQQGTGINRYAPFNGGFGFSAGYKGLYLDANWSFSQGKYLINNDAYFFENPSQFSGFNQSANILDYWKAPGDVARFPKYGIQFTQFDSRLIDNASFMRLKGLTIGYGLPQSILEKTKVIKALDVSITGRNLWTITNYGGSDPEIDSNLSLGANPNTKQIVFGLKVQF